MHSPDPLVDSSKRARIDGRLIIAIHHSLPLAKLTNLRKSPNAFGVSPIPPSPLAALASSPGRPPGVFVGENSAVDEGEVTIRSPAGSMSRLVRKDVSDRSSFVDVTDKKMSNRRC